MMYRTMQPSCRKARSGKALSGQPILVNSATYHWFRVSFQVALDTTTGKQLWKTYSILEAPKPVRKNSKGTQLYGPAGGGIWDAPTVDLKRKAIYAGIVKPREVAHDATRTISDYNCVTTRAH